MTYTDCLMMASIENAFLELTTDNCNNLLTSLYTNMYKLFFNFVWIHGSVTHPRQFFWLRQKCSWVNGVPLDPCSYESREVIHSAGLLWCLEKDPSVQKSHQSMLQIVWIFHLSYQVFKDISIMLVHSILLNHHCKISRSLIFAIVLSLASQSSSLAFLMLFLCCIWLTWFFVCDLYSLEDCLTFSYWCKVVTYTKQKINLFSLLNHKLTGAG